MGLARTPPQVVYPRATFITPTPQGAGAHSREPPSLSSATRVAPPPLVEPVTPVRADKTPTNQPRLSENKLEYPPVSSQSSGELGFTPLSVRVTPVPAARPIIAPSENGPLNAHINSLNKQLAEIEAQRKDLTARLADSEKRLDNEVVRRERTIRELAAQHEQEKQEWKETYNAMQAVHNIAHQRAKYELEQEHLAVMNLESRLLQQNVRILVRDHSLRKFQVHEAQTGKESVHYQDQLHVTKQDLEEAQQLIEQMQQQRDKEKAEHKEALKALKSQLEQERKVRSSAETGKGTLESTNAELASDLERAQHDLAAAQARIKELQDGATEAKSTQKAFEKARVKHETEVDKLNDTIESLKSKQESAKETITELEKQNRALEKERDKRVKAEVEVKALQKRVSEFEAGSSKESQKAESELRKMVKDLETKLARAQTQTKEAQEATQTAEARINTLEKKLAGSKDAPAPKPVPSKAKGKEKEKAYEQPPSDASENSKSSDQAVEELVFTDESDDDGIQVLASSPEPPRSQPKSQLKPQAKSKPSSSSNSAPASTSDKPKPRPKMRPVPPKSPSPPPRSQPQVVEDIDDDDVVVETAPPVKPKPRPKMRPIPEPSPPAAPKPASQPKGSGKKQDIFIDDDSEPESPPPKPKSRAAPAKEKAPAKAKAKPKPKEKEATTSKSKRPIDDEPDVADEAVEKKKKKRKLFGTATGEFDWGAGPEHLDTLGIPVTLSPIKDKEKVPRYRGGRL